MNLKSQTSFAAGGIVVSFIDTGEDTSWTGAHAGNETDGERGTYSDAVTRPYREKYGTDSKDTKYFLVDGL